MSSINKQILSSGNPFLDKIFSGGFQLGSIILLFEDSQTKLYQTFIKYGLAEGIISGDRILFYYGNTSTFDEVYNNLPYKSSQVENILNSQPMKLNEQKDNNSNVGDLKIAWRYENINYSNLIGELSKNLKYIFDLSRPLQDNLKISLMKKRINSKYINYFKKNKILEFVNEIIDDFQNFEDEEDKGENNEIIYNRIFITNFLEFCDNKKINLNELYLSLNTLKSMARSLCGYVFITVNKDLITNDKILNLLEYFSDYVLRIKPLLLVPDKEKVSNYDAIFHIDKFNWINNIRPLDIETNIYGMIKDKRKVIIEKIDIGVEIDRNTKVKECDLVKSDINNGNKNTTDFDF